MTTIAIDVHDRICQDLHQQIRSLIVENEKLRAALAEPVQEPVAGRAFLERILAAMEGVIDVADRKTDEFDALRSCVIDLTLMLHTAPPQRKPLTEEEIEVLEAKYAPPVHPNFSETDDWLAFARAVERAHGIGGEG